MTFAVLADEHVKRVFVTELRANGFDVAWVDADYPAGTPDVELVEVSKDTDRVIVSNDSDFTRLDRTHDHAGIILYEEQNLTAPEFIRGIKSVERFVPRAELRGRLVWLDEWIE